MSESTAIDRVPVRRVDWRRAGRAVRAMQEDPSRTDQVFEMRVALDGGDVERQFQGFLREPGGADLLFEHPDLLARLADFERLASLPTDTLGFAYYRLMRANGYDADGLRKASAKVGEFAELHPGAARAWYAQRGDCVHDLLHVLTGYGQDPAGETALLAFTAGMFGRRQPMRVVRFGVVASTLSAPRGSRLRALAFGWRAWRRGRRSRVPFSFRWEDALDRPLAAVRRELEVAPVETTHPRGVLRGQDARWQFGAAA